MAALLVLPQRPRRVLAVLTGVVLGPVLVIKVLDIGFFAALTPKVRPGA